MEPLAISDAARHLGVSPRRVRDMLAHGQLRGQRAAGVWLVDPASMPAVPRKPGQPLSQRMAWALIGVADGVRPDGASPSEIVRLRNRWDALLGEEDPVSSLRSLLARRAQRYVFAVSDPAGLLADPRVVASGRSDQRSGMADSRLAEGYVADADLDQLRFGHLLVEPGFGEVGNVVLYAVPRAPSAPVPWLAVAADLADLGPREAQQARHLIRSLGRPAGRAPGRKSEIPGSAKPAAVPAKAKVQSKSKNTSASSTKNSTKNTVTTRTAPTGKP